MTPEKLKAFAINHFGSGGHPEATKDNLHHFTQEYILECLKRARESDQLSDEALKLLGELT